MTEPTEPVKPKGPQTITCKQCGETKLAYRGFGRNRVNGVGVYKEICTVCETKQQTTELEAETELRRKEHAAEKQRLQAERAKARQLANPLTVEVKKLENELALTEEKRRLTAELEAKKKIEAKARAEAKTMEEDVEFARRIMARRRLIEFTKRFHPNYQAGWVHRDVCRRLERFLQDVVEQKSPRLMLFLPPRSGKSQLASINFPSWALGHYPWMEIIASSYAVSLPINFSRKVRELLQDPAYKAVFPKTALDKTSASAEAWLTTQGGGFVASGVGTGITGKGYHIGIMDDPVKDSEEADSEVVREKVWDWYSSVLYTRAAPGAGILCIMCMTGDTPVRLADGTQKPLAEIRAGDAVATFDQGVLKASKVLHWINQGSDNVFKITTSSGRVVKANERHPFLVEDQENRGELTWVRVKNLVSGQKIVVLKDSGESGKGRFARKRVATNRPSVGASVSRITPSGSGLKGIVHRLRQRTLSRASTLSSSIATRRLLMSISACWRSRVANALSAVCPLRYQTAPSIGTNSCASITATKQVRPEDYSATSAISRLREATLSKFSKLLSGISSFTTESIVSIEFAGREEVFDIQVEHTENFIANGIVSHNTRWHDDDVAGRLITQMRSDREAGVAEEEIDQWQIIQYPAIATHDEYVNADGTITDIPKEEKSLLVRRQGEALHPERFPLERLNKIKRTLQPRHWSALYQQNPVPDDGNYFTRSMFRYNSNPPPIATMRMFAAWDLAIGEKQTNDWTVGTIAGLDYTDQVFVVDVIRFRGNADQIAEAIVTSAIRWRVELVGIEKGQLEQAIGPTLRKMMREKRATFVLSEGDKALVPINDKLSRARPLQGRMQQGMVMFDNSQPWCEKLVEEALRFPAGTYDDQVDSLAWLMRMVMREDPPKPPRRKTASSLQTKLSQLINGQEELTPMAA